MIEKEIDTKEKIFKAAAKLFSTDGFYKVSVREICELAEVTKPVLYYYFKDKETLLMELVKETHRIGEELKYKHVFKEGSFTSNLKNIIKIYVEFIDKYPHLIKFSAFVQFMNVPDTVKQYKTNLAAEGFKELKTFMRTAQKKGIVDPDADPEILMRMLLGSIVILLTQYVILDSDIKKFEKKGRELIDFWIEKFVINKD